MLHFNERVSVDRPAWTSTVKTGLFDAYKHKHIVYRGKFRLLKDYYVKNKGLDR